MWAVRGPSRTTLLYDRHTVSRISNHILKTPGRVLRRPGVGQFRQRQTGEYIVSKVVVTMSLGVSPRPGVVVKAPSQGRVSGEGTARGVSRVLKVITLRGVQS